MVLLSHHPCFGGYPVRMGTTGPSIWEERWGSSWLSAEVRLPLGFQRDCEEVILDPPKNLQYHLENHGTAILGVSWFVFCVWVDPSLVTSWILVHRNLWSFKLFPSCPGAVAWKCRTPSVAVETTHRLGGSWVQNHHSEAAEMTRTMNISQFVYQP